MEKKVMLPLTEEKVIGLKAGDTVLLSGVLYTGRDAAHKRLCDLIEAGKELPIEIKDQVIYYVGPTPAKPGNAFGSGGPTTSYRMDPYAPMLLDLGLRGMIGKGLRSKEVIESMVNNKAVYFGAIGGAAALIGKSVVKSEVVCYEDLGAEAIRRIEVKDFPVVVVIDSKGNNLYEQGQAAYLNSIEK